MVRSHTVESALQSTYIEIFLNPYSHRIRNYKEFYNWFAEQRLTNAAAEETSSLKQDTSSKAEQPKVETKKEKKAQEKEADSSPAPESTPPASEGTAEE